MAATNDLKLTNVENGNLINLRAVSLMKPKKLQIPIVIPLPNTAPENTILFRFVGQSRELIFTFALFDDGTNVGNDGSGIITVKQQRAYLDDDIFTKNFDDTWRLLDNTGIFLTNQITGVIVSIDYDGRQGAQTVLTGTIVFQEGRVGLT